MFNKRKHESTDPRSPVVKDMIPQIDLKSHVLKDRWNEVQEKLENDSYMEFVRLNSKINCKK